MTPTFSLNSKNNIPQIGLGVWQIRNDQVAQVVVWALAAGYRHIDTAKVYGNEVGVGLGIAQSGLKRTDIFVTTKLYLTDILDPQRGLHDSLTRLGLDYVDLYLIHWPFPFWQSAWKKMSTLVDSGLTKSIGVSNFSIKQLEALKKLGGFIPAVNQIELSPFSYKKELVDYCQSQGIIVEAYSPLTHGHLIQNQKISRLAAKYQHTNPQILLRWGLQHNFVILPKSTSQNHLKDNLNIFDFEINSSDMAQLDSLNQNYSVLFPGWSPQK